MLSLEDRKTIGSGMQQALHLSGNIFKTVTEDPAGGSTGSGGGRASYVTLLGELLTILRKIESEIESDIRKPWPKG
jgi:hypothetical protein